MSWIEGIKEAQHRLSDWMIAKNPSIGLDKRAEGFTLLFESSLGPGSSVLDIGAGPGVYYEPLRRRGHDVTLLDVKRFRSCPHPLTFFDGERIPFPDKSFDASLLITVLHHTPDPEKALQEARRVTRQTVVVIEDIYHGAPGRWLAILRDALFNFEFVGHPMNFRSHQAWLETFARLGFSLRSEKDFYSHLLGLPIHTGLYLLKP